jgi:hypothetical protein
MPTIPEMQRLGWGNPDDPDFRERYIVTIVPVKGVPLYVHRAAAPLFEELTRCLQQYGAKLHTRDDDWSYANRDIRGYDGVKSYHAWGLAIDLDATENVMGNDETTFPVWRTRQLVDDLRFIAWGYEWQTRPDPMHFEIHGSREAVKRFGRILD